MAFQWRYPECYVVASDANRLGTLTVGTMDNPWRGNVSQHCAALIRNALNFFAFDAIWVPGERTAQYARRLFGSETSILRGLYSADTAAFEPAWLRRRNSEMSQGGFVFTGRLVPEKGIQELAVAYEIYRRQATNPWPLTIIGEGPEATRLRGMAGVRMLGFLQVEDIVEELAGAKAFVLPSQFEPWAVAIHEATVAGLPIICSDACGAAVELVQDGFNGFVFPAGDARALSRCLYLMSTADDPRSIFGENSRALSDRYSPALWANTLMRFAKDRLSVTGK